MPWDVTERVSANPRPSQHSHEGNHQLPRRSREGQEAPTWRMTPPPAGCRQPALQILPSCDEQPLDVCHDEAPQPEATQPMPLLGFGKEWLDPALPFAHRLLVGRGRVVAAHPVEI